MKVIRVFPRRTRATPIDPLAYVGSPDLYAEHLQADEVHVSVTFSYDKAIAERLAEEIPDGIEWEIDEYDGREHIAQKHETWY